MGNKNSGRFQLPSDKVADILNKAASGLSYTKVAREADVAVSTAFNVLKDFPLWNYFRDPDNSPG